MRFVLFPYMVQQIIRTLCLVAPLATCSLSAHAANFVVNNTADSGFGSLRAAIDSANSSSVADTIVFTIPLTDANYSATTGVATIRPSTQLPALTNAATTIDGNTQSVNRGNTNPSGPEIAILAPSGTTLSNGLQFDSSNSVVKNLLISGFANAITLGTTSSSNRIEGCYIGTNHTGLAAASVLNFKGIVANGTGQIIGGLSAGQSNRIGFSIREGMQISGGNNDVIGNAVFSNGLTGISVLSGTGHTFPQNLIWGNASLGISLNSVGITVNGVTTNDVRDIDSGPNNRQNFPVITGVSESGGNTLISGLLNSVVSSGFSIELFRNTPGVGADPTGFGEGEIYVASTSATTNASGNGTFTFTVPGLFPAGTSFSATATRDSTGDTSEFGPALEAGGTIGTVTNTLDSGGGSLRAAISRANSINGTPPTAISFNIPPTDSGFNAATGVASITVQTALTFLSAANTTIDGSTQTLNRGDTNAQGPEIALVAPTGSFSNNINTGLRTGSSNGVFKSLIISGFAMGVLIDNGDNNRIEGCYIGTDSTGTAANVIRNQTGISIYGSNNFVGGSGIGAANRIAFNFGDGVNIGSGNNNDVIGNSVFSNQSRGVLIATGTNHTVLQNSIYSNGDLGIDLQGIGFTNVNRNDVGDTDSGANNRQNLPLIASISENGGATLVSGTLNSTPSSNFTIELFRNTPAVGPNASGFGEGEIVSGSTAISTDAAGNSSWTLSIPSTFAQGTTFSATATNTATGDTSEFGPARSLFGDASIVTNTLNSGSGSLRNAINFANGLADAVISFDIASGDSGFNSSTGVSTITVQTQLPVLSGDGTTINGETQSINRGNTNPLGPEVSIVPANNQFISSGLQVDSSNNTIRGLIVSGFVSGVRFIRSGNRVLGCYIGTDYTGLAPGSARNSFGINNIGSGNFFGGLNPGEGNRIGFNGSSGIFLSVSGGDTLGSDVLGNVIFSNDGDGIAVSGGSGNTLSQNSIFNNGSVANVFGNQGINIGGNRVKPNDEGDADTGANNLQNYPAIRGVGESGGNTLVSGTLGSTPSSNFTIELFRNTPAVGPDATGFGEGEVFIASTSVSTDGNGNSPFSFVVSGTFAVGTTFTATATHLNTGDTSGFSNAVAMGETPGVVVNTLDGGSGSLRSALAIAGNFPNTNVSFDIPPGDSGFNSSTGVATITVQSPLPVFIGSGTVIDGNTQSANRGDTNPFGPEITLVTSASGAVNVGIDMGGSNNVVRGLIVSGFNIGIALGGANNRLEGSYIGTDFTGDAVGAIRNGKGVVSYASNSLIGGLSAGVANRIGFNQGRGIELAGTNNDALGNAIFSNGEKGIAVLSGNGHTLSQNSVFGNGGLGISLTNFAATEGVTPNDNLDADTNANNQQNFPIITNATTNNGLLTIQGTLSSVPNRSFVIEYFRSPQPDASGNGEGRTFLGTQTVITDGSGIARIDTQFSLPTDAGFISCTATYAQNNAAATGASPGDTSEFGPAVRALPPLAASGVLLSEFRFRGPGGSTDEYVELFNTKNTPLNISGWFIRTNVGSAVNPNLQTAIVPPNTVLPAQGHFLFTGSGFSLTNYSNFGSDSGQSSTNPPQAILSIGADAQDDSGVALFNSASEQQDAVGFTSSNVSLREGAGLPGAPNTNGTSSSQHAFMRRFKGQSPVDTGDNAADFLLLTTDGAAVAGTSIAPQLGAPNPEGLASPVNINAQIGVRVLDANFGPNAAPNRVRIGSGNGGSLVFRRIIKNNTNQPLNRIRLLITDITGQVSPVVAGQADVRVTSQADENVAVAGQGTVLVYGTTLEAPSTLPSGTSLTTVGGGGIGSSVNYDIVLTTPLAVGAERPYTFNVQVAKTGSFFVNINLLGK